MFESNAGFDFDEYDISEVPPFQSLKRIIEDPFHSPNKPYCFVSRSLIQATQSNVADKKLDGKSRNVTIVSRKFPGPAGLLPQRSQPLNVIKDEESVVSERDDTDIICSQMPVHIFHEGPWEQMIKDFVIHSTNICLPDKYNIAWILKAVKANKLINQKAPFLAGIIVNIESTKAKLILPCPQLSFILSDISGNIRGTITMSSDLYKQYVEVFKSGAVIILKQFGVLTNEKKSVQIAATANNLVRIYTQNEIIFVQDFVIPDFIQTLSEMKLKHKLGIQKLVQPQTKPFSTLQNKNIILPLSEKSFINVSPLNATCDGVQNTKRQKFHFKRKSITGMSNNPNQLFESFSNTNENDNINNSSVTATFNTLDQSTILDNIFEGMDTNALFDDF